MKREKALRPTTIIPPALYVDRQADRQLDVIVDEMGRPGYVLVARQMGKTNLLLAMKRRRSARGDVVAYIDLSNRFPNARGLFRHVIDAVVDASFAGALPELIASIRASDFEPNVEFDRSLRAILRDNSSTRFIIVLDEIDSLLNVAYSDIILSQVRSMYFARGSYPEYYRLTYILSGVVEPGNLIKDRNISPFNIGEKIYLEDFTREEADELASKAELKLHISVADRVFWWTAGNPRMTWDLLSAIEDVHPRVPDAELVDRMVGELYLTRFDRAPVDHIRDLAESSSQIREGIAAIRYSRSASLSSDIRNRLYLAGITSGESVDTLSIKNRVIDEALGDEWLRQVALGKRESLERAEAHFKRGEHREAIRCFEQYDASAASSGLPISSGLHLAQSRIALRKLDDAISQLTAMLAATDRGGADGDIQLYLGIALVEAGEPDDAVNHLREAVACSGKQWGYAQLALGVALLRADAAEHAPEVATLLVNLTSAENPGDISEEQRAWACFYLGAAYVRLGDFALADIYLGRASERAPSSLEPSLLVAQSRRSASQEARDDLVARAAQAVIEGGVDIIQSSDSMFEFDESDFALLLVTVDDIKRDDLFDDLLTTFVRQQSKPQSKLESLVKIASAASAVESDHVERLLNIGMARYAGDTESLATIFTSLRMIALTSSGDRLPAFERYVAAFQSQMTEKLFTSEDMVVITLATINHFQAGRFKEVERNIRILLPFSEVAKDANLDFYIIFQSVIMRLYESKGDRDLSRAAAQQVVDLSAKIPDHYGEVDAGLDALRQMAKDLLSSAEPNRFPQKIGRNAKVRVRLGDGREVRTKYKFVEADIRQGRTALIEVFDSN